MRTASAVVFVSLGVLSFTLSWTGGLAPAAAQSQAVAQKYHCPMHPSYVQDHKGDCPICGMKLTPVKDSGAPAARAAPAAPAAAGRFTCPMHPEVAQDHEGRCPTCGMKLVRAEKPAPAGEAVAVSAEKQKVLGIAVTPAQRASASHPLRAVGKVAPDETRLYRLNAGLMGSIRDVSSVSIGSRVRKDQVLGSFYAPDAISVMQLFILNTQGFDRRKVRSSTDTRAVGDGKGVDEADITHQNSSIYNANLQQRIMQLENMGVSALQRQEIMEAGRLPDTIKIVAPADGVVLARNVFPGLKFDRGFEFYRIADLRKVWVLADVFPQDAQHVRTGMRAEVSVPERRARLAATVTEILPQFDAATRTLKVKLTVDNPEHVLRPDMFVDVHLKIELPPAVVVPADAVIDTGLAKRVFVQTGEGVFEPRAVEIGWRSGDQVEVVSGLREGDRVVSSGTFFLDSETRMRPAASGAAAATDPVPTGHRSRGGAGDASDAGGHEEHARAGTKR